MAKAIKSPPKLKINWRGLRPVSLRTILQPPRDFLSPQKTGHVLPTSIFLHLQRSLVRWLC